jgi:hypothetical protein
MIFIYSHMAMHKCIWSALLQKHGFFISSIMIKMIVESTPFV